MMSLLLVAILALVPSSLAGEPQARDLDGRLVALETSSAPRALVFWSVDQPILLDQAAQLQSAGMDVVLVACDSAAMQARIRPALVTSGVHAVVVPDPTGLLQRRYAVSEQGGVVLLAAGGQLTVRVAPDQVAALVKSLPNASPQLADRRE
jgi:hypothetical protein